MPNHHTVKNQHLHVQARGVADPLAFQQSIKRLYHEKVIPLLEKSFDEFAGPDEVIRIDRLDLELGGIPEERLDIELPDRVRTAVRRALQKQPPPPVSGPLLTDPQLVSDLGHFLRYGSLPWNHAAHGQTQPQDLWLQVRRGGTVAWARLVEEIQARPAAWERLVLQLPIGETVAALEKLPSERWKLPLLRANLSLKARRDFPGEADFGAVLAQCRSVLPQAIWESGQSLERLSEEAWQRLIEALDAEWPAEVTILRRAVVAVGGTEAAWKKALCEAVVTATEGPPETMRKRVAGQSLARIANQMQRPLEAWLEAIRRVLEGRRAETGTAALLEHWPEIQAAAQGNLAPKSFAAIPESPPDGPVPSRPEEMPAVQPLDAGVPIRLQATPLGQNPPFPKEAVTPELLLSRNARERKPHQWADTPPWKQSSEVEYYIHNAGLVLLWPFLPNFFRACGLLEENTFRDTAAQERAVHLLQSAATGLTPAESEDRLVLNKLLCGLPVDAPLGMEFVATELEMAESEVLIGSVVKYWSALGSMSVPGFRGTWLLRKGGLRKKGGDWQVKAESSPWDLMLQFLPWGIGTIFLPWSQRLLHVEWTG